MILSKLFKARPFGFHDAGLFDENGKLLGSASSPIQIWKDGDCVEVIISIRDLDLQDLY